MAWRFKSRTAAPDDTAASHEDLPGAGTQDVPGEEVPTREPLARERVAPRGTAAAEAPPTVMTEPGPSLARGPALGLGTILLAAGLYFLYRQHGFPPLSNFPNGSAHTGGNAFLGIFGANGWTGMLTAIAGGLLLFGAAQHLLAKTMSLIVAIALGAAAIIAVFNSGNVLGLAAANGWNEIGWGASALILLGNAFLPRLHRRVPLHEGGAANPAGEGQDEAGGAAPRGSMRTRSATGRPRVRTGPTR